MIARDAEPLPPAEAARRAAAGANAFWIASPGPQGDIEVACDLVGCDPVRVVRGSATEALEAAWDEERARWAGGDDVAVPQGVPIGVGFLSYDLGRQWMRIPTAAQDDQGWPDLAFCFYDAVWRRDVDGARATIFARDDVSARRLEARLRAPAPASSPPPLGTLGAEESEAVYLAGVARILEYLRAGDVYQVNLARRLRARTGVGDFVALAASLRAGAPAPHGFFLATDGLVPTSPACLIGNSPERFLRLDGRGTVETRPIKGTRPRVGDRPADERAASELVAAAKERAEHVMIVDLERNDLGRVCRPGSIAVAGLARLMVLPTVFHLVSTVRGSLRADVGLAELVRATFPCGSITGAPKQRAMQIIEELEPVRRGPYTGATGWLGAAGDLDLAVAIRTAVVTGDRLTLSVGGGIVADSVAASELAETEAKARAFTALCGG